VAWRRRHRQPRSRFQAMPPEAGLEAPRHPRRHSARRTDQVPAQSEMQVQSAL